MPSHLPTLYDIIVGSGPGGATVARELTRLGQKVLVLEQGAAAPFTGTLGQMIRMAAVPGQSAFFNQAGDERRDAARFEPAQQAADFIANRDWVGLLAECN